METETPEAPIETKEDLEKEKLRLEIAELNRAWWKKPTYIAALFPSLLALTALIYGLANGYFQASFVKLENQKQALEQEIKNFESDKFELVRTNDRLTRNNERLFKRINDLTESLNFAADELDKIGKVEMANKAEIAQFQVKLVNARQLLTDILQIDSEDESNSDYEYESN